MVRRFLTASVSLLAALAATPAALADTSQTFNGNTAAGQTFNRPNASCSGLSGTTTRFHAQTFTLEEQSDCIIHSVQDFDGYAHIYEGFFDRTAPLDGCIAGDDDGQLGIGSSQVPAGGPITLAPGVYTIVTSGFSAGAVGSFTNTVQCDGLAQSTHGACLFVGLSQAQQVCLHGRFAVAIDNVSNHPTGIATPVRYGTTDSGLFFFYNEQNWEIMVKVLDACALNGHFWVFAGALTDQRYRINVGDVVTQQVNTYSNQLGNRAAATTDTFAFPCN